MVRTFHFLKLVRISTMPKAKDHVHWIWIDIDSKHIYVREMNSGSVLY